MTASEGDGRVEWVAVRTVEELDTLDDLEIVSGYRAGKDGDPEPGHNRSKAFWHGWRNGMIDSSRMEPDEASGQLVRDVLRNGGVLRAKGQRAAPPLTPSRHDG